MRFVSTENEDSKKMLQTIGKENIEELFSSIPSNLLFNNLLNIPKAKDERQLKKSLTNLISPLNLVNFLGAGACEHFVPEWISQQLLRAEWYTSYTPYQAEVSQGNLQAIFEFQSMIKSLLGQEIANASMYDGATALVEAVLLAHRINQKNIVLVPNNIHPHYEQTLKTYLQYTSIKIVSINFDKQGMVCFNSFYKALEQFDNQICCACIQTPNFFGLFEDVTAFAKTLSEKNIFSIAVNTDCSALALIKPLGTLGFDVCVSDGIGLVGSLSMGGPGVGLFATKQQYLRQTPGRLVGLTTDKNGNSGFVLTLSTREQHIRREKATSNICTNHNLMALALAMTLSSYGKSGFINLAFNNIHKTIYFRKKLLELGIKPEFNSPHYNETVIKLASSEHVKKFLNKARSKNIIAGLNLGQFYQNLNSHLLIATTELHEDEEITQLATLLGEEING